MKVLVCDSVAASAVEAMRAAGLEVDVKVGLKPEELIEAIPPYHCAIVRSASKITRPVVDAGKNLKLVVRGGVGIDNIDSIACKEKGIEVRNTPKASSVSVAELAIGLMFALARKIPHADRTMKEGKWEKKIFMGTELTNKTLGIVGFGNIGREVAKRALGLEMKVIAFDPMMDRIKETNVLDPRIETVSFEEILGKSDYLTLHVPFDKAKGALIGKNEFEKMKKGARLINCSRGGVVDEVALTEILKSEKLAGAAVDVFAKEPPEYRDFVMLDNVIALPHVGASTKEGQDRVGSEIVEIVADFNKNKMPSLV
ncbi:MAG TPA: hydroxyacid dehydrogenase [Chroococcales cyanobacterium]|jgi:D-3-phosphoglycerate dehydrogenase